MKLLSQTSLLLLALMVVFAGCDQAKDMASKAGDMANIDIGGMKLTDMKEKLSGITEGFKDVNEENVDGLTSKITDLSGEIDEEKAKDVPAEAKTMVSGVITKFKETVTAKMEGISDEGLMGKLKPAVDGLMEKLNAFM